MAATVEIDESNSAVEVVTHAIAKSDYGTVDTVNLDPTANAITPGNNAFEKWQRWHITAMGGAAEVRAFRFFATAPAANTTHQFNGSTVQATYDSVNHKQTAYAQPATSSTRTPETVLTTAPATGNIGVSGSLTTPLTAAGFTDYLLSQIRTTASAVAGVSLINTYRYEEVAIFLLLPSFNAIIRAVEVLHGSMLAGLLV